MIPTAQKNVLKDEVISCIVEDGKDPEECLVRTARTHGLSREQAQELAEQITDGGEDEE